MAPTVPPLSDAVDPDDAGAHSTPARDDYLLIDVRTPLEFAQMRVPGAINIPLDQLDAQIAAAAPDKQRPLVLFCKSGVRSAHACQYLAHLGYTDLSNGGTVEWVAQQLGVDVER